ncbi:hypothetical protein V6N12_075921 [Hibiscus sabdariffa]|uniref:Uncharacterized protein n=1 Tax=Hibiscus sabdariffa TaxID=183260 RepID=A0ABR2AXR0_9ROSI
MKDEASKKGRRGSLLTGRAYPINQRIASCCTEIRKRLEPVSEPPFHISEKVCKQVICANKFLPVARSPLKKEIPVFIDRKLSVPSHISKVPFVKEESQDKLKSSGIREGPILISRGSGFVAIFCEAVIIGYGSQTSKKRSKSKVRTSLRPCQELAIRYGLSRAKSWGNRESRDRAKTKQDAIPLLYFLWIAPYESAAGREWRKRVEPSLCLFYRLCILPNFELMDGDLFQTLASLHSGMQTHHGTIGEVGYTTSLLQEQGGALMNIGRGSSSVPKWICLTSSSVGGALHNRGLLSF